MTLQQATNRDDAGVGLIELIVAMVVGGIVIVTMATIFINSWKAQENVTSVSQATNRGQLIGSTIERAMRNALDYRVTDSDTALWVSTSLTGSMKCQGFRLTTGSAQMIASATTLPADAATWPQWQTGIVQRGSTPFFVDDTVVDGLVTYTFDVQTESAPVRFAGEASTRSAKEIGSCW